MGRSITPYGEFLRRAREAHGDKYTYVESSYRGTTSSVEIICSIHGPFTMHVPNHLQGRGCYPCAVEERGARRKPLGEDEFLRELRRVRGSHIQLRGEYNAAAPTLICTLHDFTFTKPSSVVLLRGQGCPHCLRERRMLSYGSFRERAREIHGDRYSYEGESTYGGFRGSVQVICSQHGPFTAPVRQHLSGGGKCPACGRKPARAATTFQEFTEKARRIHGAKYFYVEGSYVKSSSPVEIICPRHGVFSQIGGKHLLGSGCPSCSRATSSGERAVMQALEERGISYIREKTYAGLRGVGGGALRFDFHLTELDALIEFDGEQHRSPTGFYGAMTEVEMEENLRVLQSNDKIKDEWCGEHGVPLLRITDVGRVSLELIEFIEQLSRV